MSASTHGRRAREEEEEPQGPPSTRQRLTDGPLIEDPAYIVDQRVCFLRVDDHLFQIHLFHLIRDEESVFHDMLAMPAGGAYPQGFSHSDPVVLTGDTLDQIRSFHRLVYASPLEAQIIAYPFSDLSSLIEAGLFAHKYAMNTFSELALRAIQSIASRYPFVRYSFTSPTFEDTKSLLRLIWLRGPHQYNTHGTPEFELRAAIQKMWVGLVYAQPTWERMREVLDKVLDIAEEYEFRPLLGELYYLYMRKVHSASRGPRYDPAPAHFPDPPLAALHRNRLMTGYWSLSTSWLEFVENVPPVHMTRGCLRPHQHATQCASQWRELWRASADTPAVHAIMPADILAKLSVFQSAMEEPWRTGCYRWSFSGRHPVAEYKRKLEESLADHFMGLPA